MHKLIVKDVRYMKLYDKPIKAFLYNELSAVEEHDGEPYIFFSKRDT